MLTGAFPLIDILWLGLIGAPLLQIPIRRRCW